MGWWAVELNSPLLSCHSIFQQSYSLRVQYICALNNIPISLFLRFAWVSALSHSSFSILSYSVLWWWRRWFFKFVGFLVATCIPHRFPLSVCTKQVLLRLPSSYEKQCQTLLARFRPLKVLTRLVMVTIWQYDCTVYTVPKYHFQSATGAASEGIQ